jgi:hypothetical protein
LWLKIFLLQFVDPTIKLLEITEVTGEKALNNGRVYLFQGSEAGDYAGQYNHCCVGRIGSYTGVAHGDYLIHRP